jgi:hypothetical protein
MFAARNMFFAGAFSPLSLSPALWLSDTGSDAAQWEDISGNGRHALQETPARRPAIITAELNGRQVRRFDGLNDFMGLATGLNLLRNVSGASSFCVWKYNVVPNSGAFIIPLTITTESSISAGRLSVGTNLITTKHFIGGRRLDSDSFQRVDSIVNVGDSPFIQTGIVNFASRTLAQFINGSAQGSSSTFQSAGNTSDTDSLAINIGSHTGTSNFGNMDIAEILVFSAALSTADRQRVELYLSNKWAIALS